MMAAWEGGGGDTSTLASERRRLPDRRRVRPGLRRRQDVFHHPRPPVPNTSTARSWTNTSRWAVLTAIWGFPTINEVPGLAGPDSRVSTFSAADNPVIFF